MKQKIGFSLQNDYPLPMEQVLSLLRETGFDAVSPVWEPDADLARIAEEAAKQGLILQSLHGSLKNMPLMWVPEPTSSTLEALLAGIDDCVRFGIPVMVVHPWCGFEYDFPKLFQHIHLYDRLVDYAQKNGIQIAFENLEGPEFLAGVLDRYKDLDTVGYCWDSGHQLCYAPDTDFLALYGHRLLMTHLNDNMGITGDHLRGEDDMHLVPFDGIADWQQNISRLQKAKPQQILNFEIKRRPKAKYHASGRYDHLSLEEFFLHAYEHCAQVAKNYSAW